jgi:hypothetical protein
MLKFDRFVKQILKEQAAISSPLSNTMGNPGYSGSSVKPNLAQFTGYTNAKPSSDPTGASDPGSSSSEMTSQFASKALGAKDDKEQIANQFLNMAISDLEKIVNMRDASSASQTIRSVFSQLDPTGAEALAKSVESPNLNWDDFKNVLRNKISQLGNVAGSFVG